MERASRFAAEFEAALRENPALWLSWDIETPYKMKVGDEEELSKGEEEDEDDDTEGRPSIDPILRVSFAFRSGYAISIPWAGEYLGVIRRLLFGAPRYVTWNGTVFDVPVVEGVLGERLPGRNYDFMWGWHILQSDLPRGLEAVASWFTDLLPWKHLADAQPAFYSAVDADAALRNALAIEKELQEHGQWALFESHIVDLDPILIECGQHTGVQIDVKAQAKLERQLTKFQTRLEQRAQPLIPESLRPFKLYARPPRVAPFSATLGRATEKYCSKCGKVRVNKKHPCLAKEGATIEARQIEVTQYKVLLPFNPNSRAQLLAYVFHHKHPYAKDRKTGRISLPKKHLQRLDRTFGKDHPIYAIALKMRGVKKTLGTYVKGFKPDGAGKIYTTFTHAPSTHRLSSRAVNLTNVSHRGTALFAKQVRRTIIPPPGWVFVEADSSAIEAVMTGYFMGDGDYIVLAKQGIHDYLTCLRHGLEFPRDIPRCKKEFKETRDKKKVVVHGTAYGMTPRLLYYENYETFANEGEARLEQRHFLDVVPGLARWQLETRVRAHKDTYLTNPWGARHYFYDVFGKQKADGARVLGTDAKRCVAFLPQSSAASFMRDNAKLLAQAVPKEYIPANFLCHDSYLLQVPPSDVDYAVALLETTLTRRIPEMGGLTVGCEISLHPANWEDGETIKRITTL